MNLRWSNFVTQGEKCDCHGGNQALTWNRKMEVQHKKITAHQLSLMHHVRSQKVIKMKSHKNELWKIKLTHYSPVLLFYTPWKHQKIFRFSDVFRGYRKAMPGCNGLISQFWNNFIIYDLNIKDGHCKILTMKRIDGLKRNGGCYNGGCHLFLQKANH